MRLVEGVETRADGEEGDGDNNRHRTVGEDAACRRMLVLRGEITLDDRLVAGVGDDVVGQSTEDDHPEGGRAIVERPVEESELVVHSSDVEEVGGSTTGVVDEVGGCQEGSSHEDDALHHIAPDNGFDTAHRAIDDGHYCHHDDANVDVDARYGGHCQRRQEEHQRHSGHHEHDEQYGGHQADGIRETVFKIFVGCGDV